MLMRLHVLGVGGLALLAGLVLAAVLIALLALVLLVGGRAVVAHVERVEQIVDGVAERALVLDHAARAGRDSRPARSSMNGRHRSTSFLRGRRRRLAGQPLAHHHGDRILDRRIGAVGDLVELAAMEAVVEHGGEILGDAVHAARADRLDARLLDRLEHRARLLAARHQPAVHRRVVAGELAARSNRRGRARSRRPARCSLRGGSGSRALPPARPGRSAAKDDLELGLARDARAGSR